MIKLNDRLQTMAKQINEGETMADIGTDHGFLPIYLVEEGISPKVILTDISGPSLTKAKDNFDANVAEDLYREGDFRVGNGLSVLKPSEVDVVVIGGMGGQSIMDIMDDDVRLTSSFDKFILQPRNGQGYLRKWLLDNDFHIVHENLAEEGDAITEIITASSPNVEGCDDKVCPDENAEGSDMVYKVPPWIIGAEGPVGDFLTRNLEREKKKLENIMLAKTRDEELEKKTCDDIYYLKGLIKRYHGIDKQEEN